MDHLRVTYGEQWPRKNIPSRKPTAADDAPATACSSLGPAGTYRHNRVVLLQEGRGIFYSLHAALRSAERFILIEYYLIRNDLTSAALAAELTEAVRRGVRVLLIYDYLGSVETRVPG